MFVELDVAKIWIALPYIRHRRYIMYNEVEEYQEILEIEKNNVLLKSNLMLRIKNQQIIDLIIFQLHKLLDVCVEIESHDLIDNSIFKI